MEISALRSHRSVAAVTPGVSRGAGLDSGDPRGTSRPDVADGRGFSEGDGRRRSAGDTAVARGIETTLGSQAETMQIA
ncbi:unnamed protein product [Arctogadus glacialis]